MRNTLALLLSTIFYVSTTCALFLPQFRLSPSVSSSSRQLEDVKDKCTFTLWHKQICRASTKSNYIQINQLIDHANDFAIDIASYRPLTARNSYNKVSETQVYAIEGLLDDKNLTIRGKEGSDEVSFEYDGLRAASDSIMTSGDAYCVSGAWNVDDWDCDRGSRERRLECGFRCEAISEDEGDMHSNELR